VCIYIQEKVEKAHEAVKTELAALKEEAAAAKKELKKHASKVAVLERGKDDGERELEKVKTKLAAADDKIKTLGQERSQVRRPSPQLPSHTRMPTYADAVGGGRRPVVL
jgi:chromosome segregation ATPase